VVIPTHNARDLLADALDSLAAQTAPCEIVVVDNGSTDGTAAMLAERFGDVRVVRHDENRGFGRAINAVALELDADALVLLNNDVICEPTFLEAILAPFADERVGMVAGVLLQHGAPHLVDSAGIELDTTLRSWDLLWNRPVDELGDGVGAVGPCGGAASYRLAAFKAVGGFDEAFFAYWEDVDLALRLRLAGHRCASAPAARALHKHGQTLGAASPAQRRLEAFGRAFVLARYRVARHSIVKRLQIALLDWPVLVVHLVVRRETGPLSERRRGTRAGLARPPLRPPLELATVSFREALARQARQLGMRVSGTLPSHFDEHAPRAR
jgi:N-acetylglucosaminyl-diphospho-decaprenol L-rhamnosyltransferase